MGQLGWIFIHNLDSSASLLRFENNLMPTFIMLSVFTGTEITSTFFTACVCLQMDTAKVNCCSIEFCQGCTLKKMLLLRMQ